MAKPPMLYRETRLTPHSPSKSSILHIDTASSSHIPALLGAGRKRPFDEISVGLDEEQYARKHLATEGSVFFRSKQRSPRSFLWRVLDNRKLLEVQCVDLVRQKRHKDLDAGSGLTFRIEVKDAIARDGVQFADAEDVDALECFVLMNGNELVTITLKRDLLHRATVPKDFDASSCVRKYSSASLRHTNAYRFTALSSLELVVSLHDGGLLHLERKPNESGSQWRETFYSEGGWKGTFRGIIPFRAQQTVRFGHAELDVSTAAAVAKSPDGVIWTVSLDHILRAWSTKTGQVTATMDILNERKDRDAQKRQPYVMSAEQGTLLQIVTLPRAVDTNAMARLDEDSVYYILIHSPKDHRFKLYDVRHASTSVEGQKLDFKDIQPKTTMVPPVDEMMNTNIWHLEQFYLEAGPDWMGSQLWIRARSGALCRTYMLTFDIMDEDGTYLENSEIWKTGWSVVDPGPLTTEELKHCVDYPGDLDATANSAVTPSERWLEFLLYPGRFSTASLETALHTYRKGRNLPAPSSRGLKAAEQPFEERLTTAITSKIMLRRSSSDQPDYVRYQQDIQAQWQTFYSVLSHVHSRRHESLSLAFDAGEGLAWSVCADVLAPVRECSGLELRAGNTHLLTGEGQAAAIDARLYDGIYPEQLDEEAGQHGEADLSVHASQLLAASQVFRRSFSRTAQDKLRLAVTQDALHSSKDEAHQCKSLQDLYEECGFEGEVTDEDFEALNAAVEQLGGLGHINDNLLLECVEWLVAEGEPRGLDSGAALNRYGVAFTIAFALETLQRAQSILLDLIKLVVFMAAGLEAEELHSVFHADEIYEAMLYRMKHNELLRWLASHQTVDRVLHQRHQKTLPTGEEAENKPVTVLEYIFINDWESRVPEENMAMAQLLTIWSMCWINGPDIQENWDGTTAHIMARLIKKKDIELATDFVKFMGESDWSMYLQGRLHLATGEFAMASLDFQAARQRMAETKIDERLDSRLLTAEEHHFFGEGPSKYFQHVAALFEKLKVFSYAADFAGLALQALGDPSAVNRNLADIDDRKRNHDSPAAQRVDDAMDEIHILQLQHDRDDILNRLFNALVLTGRFMEAYEAVKGIAKPAPKQTNLKKLIETCVKQDAVPTLLEMDFEGDLAIDADKALAELATRDLTLSASTPTTPFYQILYAFRTQRGDFRGAAEVLYEHLERLRHSKDARVWDPEDDTLLHAYVLLVNTMACCGEDSAWLLATPIEGLHAPNVKRKLVRLEDVRREYAAELDRRSDMLQGRFPVTGNGDEMDVF